MNHRHLVTSTTLDYPMMLQTRKLESKLFDLLLFDDCLNPEILHIATLIRKTGCGKEGKSAFPFVSGFYFFSFKNMYNKCYLLPDEPSCDFMCLCRLLFMFWVIQKPLAVSQYSSMPLHICILF